MGRIEKNAKRGKNLQPKCVGFHDFKQEKYPLLPQYQFCIVINAIKFSLTRSKISNWEETFFPTTPWSLTQKARQSSLAFRQFWKFSDCTHNKITNNPSLGPGSALGEKGEKISVAKETISERSEPERESGEGKGWPFPLPNCTAGLASLADIFPVWPRFLPFFPPHCRPWSKAIIILDDEIGS